MDPTVVIAEDASAFNSPAPSHDSILPPTGLATAEPPPRADRETRASLWRDAGIVRTREGLERLQASAHPLVRLIARCALAREESRGAHQRLDFPERDPGLDQRHVVVAADEQTAWRHWI